MIIKQIGIGFVILIILVVLCSCRSTKTPERILYMPFVPINELELNQ